MPRDRFRLDEIAGSAGTAAGGERPAEQAGLLATARELEWLAADNDVGPSEGFEERVMAAIAVEPTPRPLAAAAGAARRGRPAGIFAALGDLWRVAWTGGRPLAVRAPAMALVLLLLAGSVGLGGLGAAAALGMLEPRKPAPVVTPSPAVPAPSPGPTTGPTTSPTPSPSPSPEPSESVEPSESPEPSGSPEPSESPEPSGSPEPSKTDRPASTSKPTPRPTASPDDEKTPKPTSTPHPTETPEPTGTPGPTGSPDD